MSLFDITSYVVIACYGLGTLGNFIALPGSKEGIRKLSSLCTLVGFGFHSLLMASLLVTKSTGDLSKGDLLQLLAWCLLLVYCVCWRKLRIAYLALTVSPFALLLCIASLGMESVSGGVPATMAPLFLFLHIGALFLAFALLASAFGAALLFLHMEYKIKRKTGFSAFDDDLPSLSTFDTVNRKAVLWGFPLYTLGIVSGFIWARISWGQMISWDPKELLSLCIWFLFALLFHQRLALGWQGKKAAKMLIGLFLVSMLSVVANFFMVSHHSFFPMQ